MNHYLIRYQKRTAVGCCCCFFHPTLRKYGLLIRRNENPNIWLVLLIGLAVGAISLLYRRTFIIEFWYSSAITDVTHAQGCESTKWSDAHRFDWFISSFFFFIRIGLELYIIRFVMTNLYLKFWLKFDNILVIHIPVVCRWHEHFDRLWSTSNEPQLYTNKSLSFQFVSVSEQMNSRSVTAQLLKFLSIKQMWNLPLNIL